MATISISKAFSELFAAPLRAIVDAEKEYLRIWIERLKVIQKLAASKDAAKQMEGATLGDLIGQYAPVVRLEGRIDTGLTMRIAGVREVSGSLSVGLALGPVHAAGGFGFSNTTTQESIFQASTSFVLTNKEFSLGEYLKAARIPVLSVEDLGKAIQHMEADLAARTDAEALPPAKTDA